MGPFQIVDSAHELTVWLRSTRRLLPESEVVEAVPGDPNICQVVWDGARDVVVIGRSVGSTTVTFHFRDSSAPYTCTVCVVADPEDGPPISGGTRGAQSPGTLSQK